MPRPKPIDVESRFDLPELFFSTTDSTGKIRSGNTVFQRVAKYTLAEMLGKAHSLVRHPEMPRAVFWLLWEYMHAGKPIAAYVKNLASDGSYYWVVATVVPIPGQEGYLSVRMKPTSEVFPIVEDLYAQLREIELDYEARGERDKGMQESISWVGPSLKGLGFASYDHFMHYLLPLEIRLREEGTRDPSARRKRARSSRHKEAETETTLQRMASRSLRIRDALDRQFAQIDGFIELSSKLEEKSKFVSELSFSIRRLSMNAMVGSSRLGQEGATLGVVSGAIGSHAVESKHLSTALSEHNSDAAHALRHAAFMLGIAKLQMDMILVFIDELEKMSAGELQLEGEWLVAQEGLEALVLCLSAAVHQLFDGYQAVIDSLTPLGSQVAQLYRLVQTLEITHFTGRLEASRIDDAGNFEDLFHQVGGQVQLARRELTDFAEAVQTTKKEIAELSHFGDDLKASLDEISRLAREESEFLKVSGRPSVTVAPIEDEDPAEDEAVLSTIPG